MGKNIGYARAFFRFSLEEQTRRLVEYGCWNIYAESDTHRGLYGPELSLALMDLRPGDCFVAVSAFALGASVLERIFKFLEEQGNIDFCALEEELDSRVSPNGPLLIPAMLQAINIRRNLRSSWTREGLAAARAQGRIGGRRPALTADKLAKARELIAGGQHTMAEIANVIGVARSTLYNANLLAGRRD